MLVVAILCLLSLFGYWYYRDIFAPAVLAPTSWMFVLLLYLICNHGLYELSDKCLFVILYWNSFLLLGVYLFSQNYRFPWKRRGHHREYENLWIRELCYKISFIGIFPLLYIVYKQVKVVGGNLILALRLANTGMEDTGYSLGIWIYVNTFAYISFIVELLAYRKGDKKTRLIIISIINVILAIVTASKTSIMFLIFAVFVVLNFRKSLSKKSFLYGIILLFLTMSVLQSARSANKDDKDDLLENTFVTYFFGGIPALDQIIQSRMTSTHQGQNTMALVNNIIAKISSSPRPPKEYTHDITEKGYLYVPLPTNVYTVIGPIWLDYGYIGIAIFPFIIGAFSGLCWKLYLSGKKWGVVIYTYLGSVLVLQFFGEYFFTNMSYLLQLVILSYLVYNCRYVVKW